MVYVGQAVDPVTRYQNHLEKMGSNKHTVKVQGAYNRWGEPGMVVLETCHPDHLDLLESLWINHYYFKNSEKCLNTRIPQLPDHYNQLEQHRAGLVHSTGYLLNHINTLELGYQELEKEVKALRAHGLILPSELKNFKEAVKAVRSWNKQGFWNRLYSAWTGKLG